VINLAAISTNKLKIRPPETEKQSACLFSVILLQPHQLAMAFGLNKF